MRKLICTLTLTLSILSFSMGDEPSTTTSVASSITTVTESPFNSTGTTETLVNSTSTEKPTTIEPTKNVTEPSQPLSFIFEECYDDCPDELPAITDYYHGEGLERCGVNNGLLCIANDNLQRIKPNWKGKSFSEYSNYQWQTIRKVEKNFSHENYKKGVEVIMFNNKSDYFHPVTIPSSFTESSSCLLREDLKFLQPKTIKCLRLVKEACSYAKTFLMQFFESDILQTPRKASSDIKTVNTSFEHCELFHENCTKMNGNFSEISTILDTICIDNITVKFTTNSSTIMNVSIIASSSGEKSVPCDPEDSSLKIIQTIEITFEEVNSTITKFIKRKPRGYEDGDMLLITHLNLINESDPNSEKVFDLFRNDSLITEDDLRLKIPQSRNGKCALTDEVRFNENSLIRCNVELDSNPQVNQSICQHYQLQIMDFLFHSINLTSNYTKENFVSNIYVAKSWLPVNNLARWTRVDLKGIPSWTPDERIDAKNVSIACINMPTKVSYSVKSSKQFSADAKKYDNVIEQITVEIETNGEIDLKPSDDTKIVKIEVRTHFDDKEQHNGSPKMRTIEFAISFNLIIITLYYLSF